MKLIVGLGNPGRSYAGHRHNAGFQAIDILARRHGIEVEKRSFGALVGQGRIAGEKVLVAKPQTFMNISGDAVGPLMGFYKLEQDELIVVHDDLDIELGKLKLAKGAGHGGHNGLKSIIDALGGNEFFRVRVGIGRPPAGMDAANYVLEPFADCEEKAAAESAAKAADAVETLLEKGIAAAQQKYH